MIDVVQHNRGAWNEESRDGVSPWCLPVDELTISEARNGRWAVTLTPTRSVPSTWFDGVQGKRVLCLASGGGQQAPVLAAAGAIVTSFENSEEQLAKDELVAIREGLDVALVQGDMTDLSCFEAGRFDLIFHPVSNLFVENVCTVWRECHRVLGKSGRLLSGFMNPDYFLFDHESLKGGDAIVIRHQLPFSASVDLPSEKLQEKLDKRYPLEFSHTLEDQIGGQLDAGFVIAGLYEDRWDDDSTPLSRYMPISIATLAIKQ